MMVKYKKSAPTSIWWLLMIAGTILLLVGIYGIAAPLRTFIYLIKYTGFALMTSSLLLIIHAILINSMAGEAKWLVIEGVADLLFATVLIFNPFLTVIAFPLLIGSWILVRGIIKCLFGLFIDKPFLGRLLLLFIAALSIVFGLVIILTPFTKGNSIGFAMSLYASIMGILYIYDSLRYQNREDTLVAVV